MAATDLRGGGKSETPHQRIAFFKKKPEPVNLKIETPDKQNASFEAGIRIRMSDEDPGYPAMLLAHSMFGGSLGSPLPHPLPNAEGVSYSGSFRFTAPAQREGPPFSASASI